MAQTFEIPLDPEAQKFAVPLGSNTYTMEIQFNDSNSTWFMDLYSEDGLTPLVRGIPMVTGVNLLEPFGYLGIGVELYVQTDTDPNKMPTYENLGLDSHLYMVVP